MNCNNTHTVNFRGCPSTAKFVTHSKQKSGVSTRSIVPVIPSHLQSQLPYANLESNYVAPILKHPQIFSHVISKHFAIYCVSQTQLLLLLLNQHPKLYYIPKSLTLSVVIVHSFVSTISQKTKSFYF